MLVGFLGRLLVLMLRMWRHSWELGIPHPGVHVGKLFVQLTRDAWLIWLRDSTSLKLIVVPLTTAILHKGVGPVGNVRIPPDIWRALVPGNLGELSRRSFSSLSPVTGQSAILARALVEQGLLRPCRADGLGPNGSLFAIPKNSEKASCICNMVLFNNYIYIYIYIYIHIYIELYIYRIRPKGAVALHCDCLALSLWLFYK